MLKIENFSKKTGKSFLFQNLSLQVVKGEKIAIIGSSGIGKSTFLRCLAGLESFSGKIHFSGTKTFVFQDFNLFPHFTVFENITYVPFVVLKKENNIVEEKLQKLCKLFSFDESLLTKYPAHLSGGQQQRVALMRGILLDVDLLILDEPSSALDTQTSTLIADFLKTEPYSIIFATHDPLFTQTLANKVLEFTANELILHEEEKDLI